MKLKISEIRIRNFRSIKELSVKLNELNLLIGQNNGGKSNFLSALDFGIRSYKEANINDIFWSRGEERDSSKEAVIDIKIVPNDEKELEFDAFWGSVFTEEWITTEGSSEYVGIRTIIKYDPIKSSYVTVKKPIQSWGNTIDSSKVGRQQNYKTDMTTYINEFFIDALRDFSSEMKDKKSYFGKTTSTFKLSDEKTAELERSLSSINDEIVSSIDVISETSKVISGVAPVLGTKNSEVKIEPMARTLKDLHRGMDVIINDGNAESFSINEYGMGTKSWLSYLSLKAYVNFVNKKIKEEYGEGSTFDVLLLEEPEAHLHPQAQKQLYIQLQDFNGQKIVSTHSANIISQADPEQLILFKKDNGETKVTRFDASLFKEEEINKIKREILKSKGELLFSNCVVLCEGITEEIELPIYFESYFGVNPNYYGITIIGVGGRNYSTFIKLLDMFSIKWFILSDGEEETLKILKNVLKPKNDDLMTVENLIYFDNLDCIESYLVRDGYYNQIIEAIEEIDGEGYYTNSLSKNPIKLTKMQDSGEICPQCKKAIKKELPINLNGLTNGQYTLFKFITRGNGKAKYCEEIALKIVDSGMNLPTKFTELFKKIKIVLEIEEKEEIEDDNETIE